MPAFNRRASLPSSQCSGRFPTPAAAPGAGVALRGYGVGTLSQGTRGSLSPTSVPVHPEGKGGRSASPKRPEEQDTWQGRASPLQLGVEQARAGRRGSWDERLGLRQSASQEAGGFPYPPTPTASSGVRVPHSWMGTPRPGKRVAYPWASKTLVPSHPDLRRRGPVASEELRDGEPLKHHNVGSEGRRRVCLIQCQILCTLHGDCLSAKNKKY